MSALKTSQRHRKITRKRVFAEFVSSCVTCSDPIKEEISKKASQEVSLLPNLKYTPNTIANRSKVIKSKSTKHIGLKQRTSSNLDPESGLVWLCCGTSYSEVLEIHKHVAKEHQTEIDKLIENRLSESDDKEEYNNTSQSCAKQIRVNSNIKEEATQESANGKNTTNGKTLYRNTDVLPWLPSEQECSRIRDIDQEEGEILLFYKYLDVEDPHDLCAWQQELCRRLGLTGKIRIATEGINGTVGGPKSCTGLYMKAVQNHPVIQLIDFKTSNGSATDFPKGLQCGVHSEIVPMGVNPSQLSYTQAGKHLSPDEFHNELEAYISKKTNDDDTVFIDCRNFYESRIGQFQGAVAPDIRKFSYWPEYVDQNVDKFQDKRVIMYCTGGIRCERGSAYLKSKGVCKDVLQLHGGIHRYMEKYPNGLFQGKLFVFDDRYSIATNDSVISKCSYCGKPWDKYQPCSSPHCHQLVLSCQDCKGHGSTACCHLCKDIAERSKVKGQRPKEECECTKGRVRIPQS